jgi:dienelactone hydrolase
MRRAWLALALTLLAAGCGGGAKHAQPPKPAPSPFAYDASQPLDVKDGGRVNSRSYPIAVRDVSYAVPGGRVQGYLAVPPGTGRVPAVLFLHGAGGDRRELLLSAVWLAGRRVVTLTITSPSSDITPVPRETPAQALARDKREAVADVVAARRAVDFLRSLSRVDPARIGLVGWSLGAHTGAILAGVEPRIRAFALMSGGAVPVSQYVAASPVSLRPAVQSTLTAIDPLSWIRRGRSGTILLQDGFKDTVVPRAALLALVQAAPRHTVVRWYQAGHALDAKAYHDQNVWLATKLHIHGPPVKGAKTGP